MSFSNKQQNLPISCDDYLDLYEGCNIGCEMCKFNLNTNIKSNEINFERYVNKKVLFSYKSDPYALMDYELVKVVVNKLHDNNCKIVLLTRRVDSLIRQLNLFNKNDYVGFSLSENCSKNAKITDILIMLYEAKRLNLKLWLSLEPVITAAFANEVIMMYADFMNLIRIGKNDLLEYDWESVSKNIISRPNVYIKR